MVFVQALRKLPAVIRGGERYARAVFGRAWRIGSVGGIPVSIDSSWVWIAAFFTYSLWTWFVAPELHPPWSRFATSHTHLSNGAALGYAVFSAALFFGSVFLHEMAHAVAARLAGIRVLGITLVFFGGFTSARSDEKGPGPAFVISAVGPGMSLALGGLFWLVSTRLPSTDVAWAAAFGYVGLINLFMAGLNALPGLPLDGGRMLQAAVWRVTRSPERGTRTAARAGMGVGALLLAAGLFWTARSSNPFSGLWFVLIGLVIFQGARASERQIDLRARLAHGTVTDAMDPPPPAVPAEMALSEALDRYLRGHEEEAFPVVEAGKVIGMVSFNSAREPGMQDPLRPVRDALIPLANVLVAHPDERLDAAASRLGTDGAALVLRDGELVGAITGNAVLRWATSR